MDIQITQAENETVFALSGRLDTVTAPQLQAALLPAFEQATSITLDLNEIVYLSSAGLRVLLLAQKTAQAKGAALRLTRVCPEVMEVFVMTGFSDMLTIL